jgi:GAF domain-containing protein
VAEELSILSNTSKVEKYISLLPQIEALIGDEPNLIANLANVSAALKQTFGFFWVGFYLVEGKELVLGPFQGPIACSRIALNKGICGKAWKDKKTVVVPNVDLFPGHIACSSASKSEIVVPAFDIDGNVQFVLDVDSDILNDFNEVDQQYLEKILLLLG